MTNYLYNGIELPALPEWDRESYPYAVLWTQVVSSSGIFEYIYVWAFDHPVYYDPDTYMLTTTAGAKYIAFRTIYGSNGAWGEWENYGEGTSKNGNIDELGTAYGYTETLLWADHDVYTPDGTLYLAASEPVPVSTWTPDPASLLMGYRVGQILRGMRKKVEKTPIGYSYNGTVLPALPEWDREVYPYAYIGIGTSPYYFLYCSTTVSFEVKAGNNIITSDKPVMITGDRLIFEYLSSDGGDWSEAKQSEGTTSYLTDHMLWTNFNIIDATDNSVFLAASDPVPVYE